MTSSELTWDIKIPDGFSESESINLINETLNSLKSTGHENVSDLYNTIHKSISWFRKDSNQLCSAIATKDNRILVKVREIK